MHFTAYQNEKTLPRPAYVILAIACAVIGVWASIITLRYFIHGATILEADDAAKTLAVAAAVMFVCAEMGAFGLFSLLPAQRMYALRWQLITFVVAVVVLEIVTTVAVQMAMTKSADMGQQTAAQRAQDLRRQIAQAETDATALRAQAGQLANASQDWVKAGASKVAAMAASASAKTDGLYDELAKVDSTQHPTLIGMFGEGWAMAYAVVRGVLVSCAGLVFWGAVGALVRAFMGAGHPHQNHYQQPQPMPLPEPMNLAPQPIAPQPAPAPAAGDTQPSFTPDWQKWGNAKVGAAALALGAATTAVPNTAEAAQPTQQVTSPAPSASLNDLYATINPCPACGNHDRFSADSIRLKRQQGGTQYYSILRCMNCHHSSGNDDIPIDDLPTTVEGANKRAVDVWNANTQPASEPAPFKVQPASTYKQNVPEQVQPGSTDAPVQNVPEQVQPASTDAPVQNVPEQVQPASTDAPVQNVPEQVQPASTDAPAQNVPEQVQRRSTSAGVKIDTGVGKLDGFRYRRVRAAVKAGKLAPSIRAIKLAEGGRDEVVRGYLAQMEREGLIERLSNGRWRLKAQPS